eukprot:TRINITY_DN12974_c0_g2_i1.p1 TRINITY_DN12974_c0_g2~~TRINITY_DN12974_c0_g2_i1.p1  ORF type:complete len:1770 (-),score=371.34 TRINITY_DN12974_c0_g2_i1:100-5346(-)
MAGPSMCRARWAVLLAAASCGVVVSHLVSAVSEAAVEETTPVTSDVCPLDGEDTAACPAQSTSMLQMSYHVFDHKAEMERQHQDHTAKRAAPTATHKVAAQKRSEVAEAGPKSSQEGSDNDKHVLSSFETSRVSTKIWKAQHLRRVQAVMLRASISLGCILLFVPLLVWMILRLSMRRAATQVTPLLQLLQALPEKDRTDGSIVNTALKAAQKAELLPGDSASPLLRLLPLSSRLAFEDTSSREGLSYSELAKFLQTGIDFAGMRLAPGERVAFVVPNGAEAAVLLLACLTHYTAVPLNPAGTQQEFFADAQQVKAKVLIVHESYLGSPREDQDICSVARDLGIPVYLLKPDAAIVGKFSLSLFQQAADESAAAISERSGVNAWDDTALLLFTSGTSGSKKCVPYDLGTLLVGATCIVASWQLAPKDKVLNMMPLFHVGGIMRNVLSVVLSGGSAILCPAFDAVMFWNMVQKHRQAVTWYYAGPVMHQLILDEFESRGLESYRFRFIANAAGGLMPSLAEKMAAAYGCTVLPGYGMTECMPISAPPLSYELDRKGTSGLRIGPELNIFDDSGRGVERGEIGKIVVRGPPLFKGYENDEEATKAAFVGDGWFNTGDVGYMDEDGYLYIIGRSKEVINRGGEIISPLEVEKAVQEHPNVKSALAFSVPHDVLDETVGVAVVMREGVPQLSLKRLQAHCKKSLTFAKWPQVLVLMPDLPKNTVNKPLRTKLAERLGLTKIWGGALSDSLPATKRVLYAGCPAVGTSLQEPIPDVRPLSVDTLALSYRLRDEAHGLGIQQAFFVHTGEDERLNLAVTPFNVEKDKIMELIGGKWHDWELPETVVAVHKMPTTEDGAIDQVSLSILLEVEDPNYANAQTPTEQRIQRIWEDLLQKQRISVEADFFDRGGTSLLAGPVASSIKEAFGVHFTVLDAFAAPTIRKAAALVDKRIDNKGKDRRELMHRTLLTQPPHADEQTLGQTHPIVLLVQLLPMFVFQPLKRVLQFWLVVHIFFVVDNLFKLPRVVPFFAALIVGKLCMDIMAPLWAITMKWLIVGRLEEGTYPVFGSTYLRWWLSNQILRTAGMGVFIHYPVTYYRLLGAKIGEGVNMSLWGSIKEPGLVSIGKDVCLDECYVQPFALAADGTFTLRRIEIGAGCSVGERSVIAGGTGMPAGTCVGPLSSSHELQDATPENAMTNRLRRPRPPFWLRLLCGYPILLGRRLFKYIPVLILLHHMILDQVDDKEFVTVGDVLTFFTRPARVPFFVCASVLSQTVCPILALLYAIMIKKTVIGRFKETRAAEKPDMSAWQLFRPWLMAKLLKDKQLGGVTKLLGRHYEMISRVYRLLGCKVGKHVYWPASGFRLDEPDLLEIGDCVVFGSRSCIMTSDAENRRRKVVLQSACNVSDRCFLAPGTTVGSGVVLGSGALTKANTTYADGTYVGSIGNECILLKKGVPDDASSSPSSAYAEAFSRPGDMPYTVLPEEGHIIWSIFCIMVASVQARLPMVMLLMAIHYCMDMTGISVLDPVHILWMFGVLACALSVTLLTTLIIDISSKWLIMGHVPPGEYSWNVNNYSQRWQLYLSCAPLRFFISRNRDYLSFIEGSQYLVWYFRALGATIGKNVCLYPNGASPMMTEPDSIKIGDGAGIDAASLTAHLNTKGSFSIQPIEVGEGCILRTMSRLQQAARLERKSVLLEHTLVLPGDAVQAGEWRQGWPAGRGWIFPEQEHQDPAETDSTRTTDSDIDTQSPGTPEKKQP